MPVEYIADHKYPVEIRNIILGNCATSGCHNAQSKDAAAGLNLETWEKLFEGGRNGVSVIPYRPDQSFLFSFINTYSDLGVTLKPTMPLNKNALSRNEVLTVKRWIEDGAPDAAGVVKFSDNPKRDKFYVVNQGCDLVAVYDAETKLIMRYVDVGKTQHVVESPHMIKISPDKKYWYVIFYNGTIIQRFRTSDDTFAGQAEIGTGLWNTFSISSDSKTAYCVDWSANGKVAVVDLEAMSRTALWQGAGLFSYPHGSSMGVNDSVLYLTSQTGNFLYKIHVDDPASAEQIRLNPSSPPSNVSSLDPHELAFSPDRKKYFVTCQKSNEVRIMQSSNDSLLAVIAVGVYPQEIAVSVTSDYIFVSCMEDTIFNTSGRGSVAIINYKTNTLVDHRIVGYQPHGIAVDDTRKLVYIANRNQTLQGPAPHHASACGGRNGYVTIMDIKTLNLIDYKSETSVDPFSIVVRN